MTCTFSPTFKAEWSKLTDEQKFTVLGELMDPGVGGIGGFDSEDIHEALSDVTDAYSNAYQTVRYIIDDDDPGRDSAAYHREAGYADYCVDQRSSEI